MKSMLVDTSGKFLSVSVCENQQYVGGFSHRVGPKMNELLLDYLNGLMASIGMTFKDIDAYYVIVGPGSFTGIRIGVAALLGITSAFGKDLKGISSLDAAALVTGKEMVTVAAKLRAKEHVRRCYDFSANTISDYEFVDREVLGDNSIVLHTSSTEGLDLSKALLNDRFDHFVREYTPFYMRKSEAEISFDNRSKEK